MEIISISAHSWKGDDPMNLWVILLPVAGIGFVGLFAIFCVCRNTCRFLSFCVKRYEKHTKTGKQPNAIIGKASLTYVDEASEAFIPSNKALDMCSQLQQEKYCTEAESNDHEPTAPESESIVCEAKMDTSSDVLSINLNRHDHANDALLKDPSIYCCKNKLAVQLSRPSVQEKFAFAMATSNMRSDDKP